MKYFPKNAAEKCLQEISDKIEFRENATKESDL